MAIEIGTASDFNDLYTKLRDFLTTNTDLVTAGEEWTVLEGPAVGALTKDDELLLQGPGSAGADEILVGLHPSYSVGADYYNLGIAGYSSYNSGLALTDQPNRLAPRYIHLWDGSMPYWFIANGRRFMVVVRVTTVFQSAYAGFILPYHLPTTWAYPLFIGGCSRVSTWRYSVVNHGQHSAFFNPGGESNIPPALDSCSAAIRLPDGQWIGLANKYHSGNEQDIGYNNVAPWSHVLGLPLLRDGLDGQYKLIPAEIAILSPYPANLGALEGVWYVPGFGTASENTVTVDSVDHLIVQNVYRTSNNEYAALALE